MLPFADKSHARVGRINRFNCGFLVTKILLSVHMFQITGEPSSSPGQIAGGQLFSFLKNKNKKTNEQMKMRHQEKTKPPPKKKEKKTPLGSHNFWINQLWLYHKKCSVFRTVPDIREPRSVQLLGLHMNVYTVYKYTMYWCAYSVYNRCNIRSTIHPHSLTLTDPNHNSRASKLSRLHW